MASQKRKKNVHDIVGKKRKKNKIHEDRRALCFSQWPSLPDEIWILVLQKLPLEDFIRCQSVCSSWFSIIRDLKSCSAEPRIPWLILPPEDICNPTGPYKFFDIVRNKMHKLHLPELESNYILGSSNGWLIVEDLTMTKDKLRLFNPFTRALIQLPSTEGIEILRAYLWISFDSDYAVVLDHGCSMPELSFARTGDTAWTNIDFQNPRQGNWIGTFCNGNFYVLDDHRRVLSFDLSRYGAESNPIRLPVLVPPPLPRPLNDFDSLLECLVVLQGGENLMLFQLSSSLDEIKIVSAFMLEQKETRDMRNLGGHTLFLTDKRCGTSSSIICHTNVEGLVKRDCVYIADQKASLNLFDVKVQSITRVDELSETYSEQPMWLNPVLVKI